MGDLTEVEIFACLKENFRLASEDCLRLARGERGPVYRRLRDELRLIEGTLRQAAWWRQDTRWLYVVPLIAKAHQSAGQWLREKGPETGRKFAKLAEILKSGQKAAEDLQLKRTERLGLILPKPLPAPHRETRPVTVKTPSGIILRPGATVH
jgi:hypothetical protein